jgi:dynein heavy chain
MASFVLKACVTLCMCCVVNAAQVARTILSKLPPPFDLVAVSNAYPVSYSSSMNTVLLQEVARLNTLLSVVSTSLTNLRCVVLGAT